MHDIQVMVSAGELSGDRFAAGVVRALPDHIRVFGIGGPALREAGADIRIDITRYAAVGVSEALRVALPAGMALLRARRLLRRFRPRLLLLVDCQGFNLPLAAAAKKLGIRTVYFIPPQNFLWEDRLHARRTAERIDYMLHIYRRSEVFYSGLGVAGEFVGHPLLDLQPAVPREPVHPPVWLFFPGSRRAELRRHLPLFVAVMQRLRRLEPQSRFTVVAADPRARRLIGNYMEKKNIPAQIVDGAAWPGAEAARCRAALCKSGTVSLQCALARVPAVVVYRVSALSALLLRRMTKFGRKLRFIALPNLLLGRPLYPELVQQEARPEQIARKLAESDAAEMQEEFAALHSEAGPPGVFARAAAALVRLAEG